MLSQLLLLPSPSPDLRDDEKGKHYDADDNDHAVENQEQVSCRKVFFVSAQLLIQESSLSVINDEVGFNFQRECFEVLDVLDSRLIVECVEYAFH
jgi:hypothetical protein